MVELLKERRAEIVDRWVGATLRTYPSDAMAFYEREKDPFANPVGASVRTGLGPLFDALLSDAPSSEYGGLLDGIIRVRCVQGFPPSWAVSFVFLLKGVIREVVSDRPADAASLSALMAFESRIDRMAASAFDVCSAHLRRIADIRVQEMKNSVATLMRMSALGAPADGSRLTTYDSRSGAQDSHAPQRNAASQSSTGLKTQDPDEAGDK